MKYFLVILFAIVLSSCGKSDDIPPVISVTTPTDNQVFTNGQSINVQASMTDETGLHMVHLIVTDNNGLHIDHFEEHYEEKTYALNRSFIAQAGKTYTIYMDATDHGDNTTKKELKVSAN